MAKSWVENNVLKSYHLNDIVEVSLHENISITDQGHDFAHTRVGYLKEVTAKSIVLTTLKLKTKEVGGESYQIPYERINTMQKAKLV